MFHETLGFGKIRPAHALQNALVVTSDRPSRSALPAGCSYRTPSGTSNYDMQRQVIAELLDHDLGTPAEIAGSLADLRHISRWFGGTRTTVSLLRRVAREHGGRQLSMLEVGAAAGDLPLAAQRTLAREGVALHVTLLDRISSHLPTNGTTSIAGDALHLPFRDGAFDAVGCSLLAHHFESNSLQLFVREALRVCRRAVLINDLIRSRLHLGLVYLGLPLFRSRITWHDAPASVRQAYTVDEMREVLSQLPAQRIEITRHYLYRMGVLVWKHRSALSI
jgi:ubiquinone/menaquinone biosynthesis C-methylase UbiE